MKNKYNKYINLDETRKIKGCFLSEKDMNDPESPDYDRTDIMLIPDDFRYMDTIGPGWRLSETGEWLTPEPPAEDKTPEREIRDISSQLKTLHKREEYLNYLGLDPDSEEAEALAPYPEPRVREARKPYSLRTMFARLAGELVSEPEVLTVKMESFSIQDKPTKEALLASLKEKQVRLAAVLSIK